MEPETDTRSLEEAISVLCRRVESLAPGARTGVCIASADGTALERSVFPNFPPSFQSAIRDIPMGAPYFGNCTAAMSGREVITTENLEQEERFDPRFVGHCMQHAIRSLQSRPVFAEDGTPLGTFVMGFEQPRKKSEFDEAVMLFAADAVTALLRNRKATGDAAPGTGG